MRVGANNRRFSWSNIIIRSLTEKALYTHLCRSCLKFPYSIDGVETIGSLKFGYTSTGLHRFDSASLRNRLITVCGSRVVPSQITRDASDGAETAGIIRRTVSGRPSAPSLIRVFRTNKMRGLPSFMGTSLQRLRVGTISSIGAHYMSRRPDRSHHVFLIA
jgi:hypothetical protein